MLALTRADRTAFEASAATTLLRALANERRLVILCQLGEGEMSVG
ncbi:MAG: ArsR family transcriptional regulator, partial [Alphaproteobacteria bacterium]|nr:ArsR family transcriptional regulator [Alphaproteobacteria bacterium]